MRRDLTKKVKHVVRDALAANGIFIEADLLFQRAMGKTVIINCSSIDTATSKQDQGDEVAYSRHLKTPFEHPSLSITCTTPDRLSDYFIARAVEVN